MDSNKNFYQYHKSVSKALKAGQPIVALESTVVTHGLPYPTNLELAANMEKMVSSQGATPATIGVLNGKVCIGLTSNELESIYQAKNLRKISSRDYGAAIARKECGGTTVAGTLLAAEKADIRVFATGGIGGVHRGAAYDVSADLPQLGKSPLVVVCAGAKSILDLPVTLEVLETLGVPVVGYETDEFPAFYSRTSGLPLTMRADSPEEVAELAKAHWGMGNQSAVLLVVPIPEKYAVPQTELDSVVDQALAEAEAQKISGQAVTPFLLARVSELSEGHSLQANLELLLNNARVAARVAVAIANPKAFNI